MTGYGLKKFEYSGFVDSVKERKILNDLYYVNKANLMVPDYSGFKMETNDLLWLNSQLNKIYDNGPIVIFLATDKSSR